MTLRQAESTMQVRCLLVELDFGKASKSSSRTSVSAVPQTHVIAPRPFFSADKILARSAIFPPYLIWKLVGKLGLWSQLKFLKKKKIVNLSSDLPHAG